MASGAHFGVRSALPGNTLQGVSDNVGNLLGQ